MTSVEVSQMSPHFNIQFGIYLPQLQMSFETIRNRVQLAERLGFHSAWFMDHLYAPGMPQVPAFEAWTTISALATVTERIRLGHLVLCNSFRHPAVLAKMATSLDVISGGRLDLGIGSGSVPDEHRMFGLPFPGIRERTERLEESIQVMKLLFTQDEASFNGKYYQLDKAPSALKPLQQPHPPFHVGGGGEKFTLPLVARCADAWNCPTYSLGELERKIEVLRTECERANRDFDTLRISEEAVLVLAPTKAALEDAVASARRRYGGAGWGLDAGGFIGTPDDIIKRIREKAALGVSLFVFFFHDRGRPETLKLFAREVAPAFA